MRKLVLFMHVSLDGFVAGTNGEMDWIKVDEELFEYAGLRTREADTALYGRVTYEMMQGYWPAAADQPDASKHDIEHSEWYNRVAKVVISNTLPHDIPNTTVIGSDLADKVRSIKRSEGREIVIFGSPSASHALMHEGLIDDYWLFINPVLLGNGIPLFKNLTDKVKLKLLKTHEFKNGVVCLHYEKDNS